MPYTCADEREDGVCRCVLVACREQCDLTDPDDLVLQQTVAIAQRAYDEQRILQLLADAASARETEESFDLTGVMAVIRSRYPDPNHQTESPEQLKLTRSEAMEMVAQGLLQAAFQMQFPVSPQRVKLNTSNPVLGFDAWGMLPVPGTQPGADDALQVVLVMTKGTDESKVPSQVSRKLAAECAVVPDRRPDLATAAVIVFTLTSGATQALFLRFVEHLARVDDPLPLVIAPVVVRGVTTADLDDFKPLLNDHAYSPPTLVRGATVSLGVDLQEFADELWQRVRSA